MDSWFKLPRDEIVSSIEKLVKVCERKTGGKSSLPHFFYIRFDGAGKQIKMSAYNAIRRAAILVGGVGDHLPFSVGVSGSYLNDLKGVLPKSDIMCSVSNDFALSGEGFSVRLAILGAERFPQDPTNEHKWVGVNYEELFPAFAKISYCAGDNDSLKAYARSVCVTKDMLVCTDGFRMSLVPNTMLKCEKTIMLPPDSVDNCLSMFEGVKGEGFIEITDQEAHFSSGSAYLSTRLVAGDAPNFSSVIPSGPCIPCVLPRDRFRLALNRMSVVSGAGKKSVPIHLLFEGGVLTLKADRDGHKIEDKVPVVYSSERFTMTMDMRYLLEAATAIKEEKVHMELRGNQMAVVITDGKGEHKNVILPHR